MWELRYKINQFDFEVVGRYNNEILAKGMKKKYIEEVKYPANKLTINKI